MSTTVVEVENLSFRYDKRLKENILSNISMTVDQGEWLAVIGPNGSGKSTLAQLLVGLIEADSGKIRIKNTVMDDTSKWKVRRHIGIVFQNPENQFIGTTVQDDVAFSLENLNMPYDEMKFRVDQALDLVGMSSLRHHDPSQLSGGQKQRVAIAGILALKPSILVLDEALVMLDPKSRRELLTVLQNLKRKENISILSITHDMNEAALADRIILLESGKVKNCGTSEQLFVAEPDLEPPFPELLRRELLKRNRNIPNEYMTEEEMVNWLCKSRLTV
ncbi:energy-coupling factor transporter ATPase [Aquibacillus rhizosphaerae]|uniref:Energy-coupling factor transporter ATPase n=1 Tax=Aquibacillus rhizosphaerae TaxID=3051431 RepID=A0ABT7L3Q1_9BACI|nr:energy-coupling factor transporter ATPase [Aquibacillus sp. LR5S19]MDL4840492.1 energy-coupling factor transporter ATPase [Aquibacillus sp. LR5S19]